MRGFVAVARPLMMRWMAPTAGIAMCQIAAASEVSPMSAYGYKRTFGLDRLMSALHPKADIAAHSSNVRL